MRWVRFMLWMILGVALIWVAGRLVFPVPPTEGRDTESAIPFDESTTLGPRAAEALTAHPGQSGVVPLPGGTQALQSRLALIQGAERSLDVMYYIWHDDESGLILMDTLRDAAERGVRVRLLLDDNGIAGLDPILAALNTLPDFSVRLFNPSVIRQPKMLGFALYPLRMNRRMHNKALIVDGAAAIVGGRNIGNEYFAVGDAPAYLDLDVLGVGQVVPDTARIFDEYWNSQPVLALEQVISGSGDMQAFDRAVETAQNSEIGRAFTASARTAASRMTEGEAPSMEWTTVQVVADDPAKGVGEATRSELMITRLRDILGGVDRSLDLISAYFVPGRQGSRMFAELARDGARIRVLTNSWQATDVPMVHAGYVKYRRELLEAGVQLYELKHVSGSPAGKEELGPVGSSGASLHAKTFSVDDARLFIGSFNFDPRSALLNCEMGFLIESADMARAGADAMTDRLADRSYQPMLVDGDMQWRDPQPDGTARIIDSEPDLGLFDRVLVYILNLLPIEGLL
ncbi:phospholipase D family protein [Paracoccus aerodenitrificans]|uniref:phospholipase D family protein n=1 Tax=Paracoccus aerodenitrificans TaxID=3017781 RepID=UPI0022F0BD99|nr:phospholipase D family protein [Paracoccus aerodenitrificans]WBU64109.1 phospholipase D family protein [Paracoccus aerodenitrificans]